MTSVPAAAAASDCRASSHSAETSQADDDPAISGRRLRTAARHRDAEVRRQHVSAEKHRRLLVPRVFADLQGLLARFSIAMP
jgi:hypothetical protein